MYHAGKPVRLCKIYDRIVGADALIGPSPAAAESLP